MDLEGLKECDLNSLIRNYSENRCLNVYVCTFTFAAMVSARSTQTKAVLASSYAINYEHHETIYDTYCPYNVR